MCGSGGWLVGVSVAGRGQARGVCGESRPWNTTLDPGCSPAGRQGKPGQAAPRASLQIHFNYSCPPPAATNLSGSSRPSRGQAGEAAEGCASLAGWRPLAAPSLALRKQPKSRGGRPAPSLSLAGSPRACQRKPFRLFGRGAAGRPARSSRGYQISGHSQCRCSQYLPRRGGGVARGSSEGQSAGRGAKLRRRKWAPAAQAAPT